MLMQLGVVPEGAAPDPEAALVERARSDEKAFRELYQRCAGGLYRYAYYRTGNRQDAEDIVAQTFLRVWRGLPGYRNVGIPFSHWLYRIASNVVTGRSPKREEPVAEIGDIGDGGSRSATGSAADLVAEKLDLAAGLRALPDQQQQVLALRYVVDLPVAEVARIMQRSENAVKQLAFRALGNLKRRMSADA